MVEDLNAKNETPGNLTMDLEVIKYYGVDPDDNISSAVKDNVLVEKWPINIPDDVGVVDLKILINKTHKLTFQSQILIYEGKILDELRSLRDYLSPMSSRRKVPVIIVTNATQLRTSENPMRLFNACKDHLKTLSQNTSHYYTDHYRKSTSKTRRCFRKIALAVSFIVSISKTSLSINRITKNTTSSENSSLIDILKKPLGMRSVA